MKKSALIKILEEIEGDPTVYIGNDGSGEGTKLWSAQVDPVIPQDENAYRVDVLAPEDVGTEYDEEDVSYVVVLW